MTQFGPGPDGSREATWYEPLGKGSSEDRCWVFQAKYHSISQRGWNDARARVLKDLETELDSLLNKHRVPCDNFVLVTNVPLTGVRFTGSRDRVDRIAERWIAETSVERIEVWDGIDLTAMLDADPDTRVSFLDDVLPGDVLRAVLLGVTGNTSARDHSIRAYLRSVLRSERKTRGEETGEENGLELSEIFTDLDLEQTTPQRTTRQEDEGVSAARLLSRKETAPASHVLVSSEDRAILLLGGPGSGKSTLTQFATLLHAARIVDPKFAKTLLSRLKAGQLQDSTTLDFHGSYRLPFRIELRRYAQWLAEQGAGNRSSIASYLVQRINTTSSGSLAEEDLFTVCRSTSVLLCLDGLDEVPSADARKTIFRHLHAFLDRFEASTTDVVTVLSSRPQGYRNEFAAFEPAEYSLLPLTSTDFDGYVNRWLAIRIADEDSRTDAKSRIDEATETPAVRGLATTLLQATVMLTIASQGHRIPQARFDLFEKYVDVIFQRERNKKLVREHEHELRRLHARLGYERLRKMESSEATDATLRLEEFQSYVRDVISDYSGHELGAATIDSMVEQITHLAQDRLCFIAGKGSDQSNFDFIIQPFREYFAAKYLSEHPDADATRVFSSLVRRSHFWGGTLQFYAAQQTEAQKKAWIGDLDGLGYDLGTGTGILDWVRQLRTMIQVLPEYNHPRNQDVDRAIQNLFSPQALWTWSPSSELAAQLKAFSSSTPAITEKYLRSRASGPKPSLQAMELLLALGSPNCKQLLFELASRDLSAAIHLSLTYGEPLDLTQTDTVKIRTAHARLPSKSEATQEFRLEVSEGALLSLGLNGLQTADGFPESKLCAGIRSWVLRERPTVRYRNVDYDMPPWWGSRPGPETGVEEQLGGIDDDLARYIASLMKASKSPKSQPLRDAVAALSSTVSNPIWSPHWQLPPVGYEWPSDSDPKQLSEELQKLVDENDYKALRYLVFPALSWNALRGNAKDVIDQRLNEILPECCLHSAEGILSWPHYPRKLNTDDEGIDLGPLLLDVISVAKECNSDPQRLRGAARLVAELRGRAIPTNQSTAQSLMSETRVWKSLDRFWSLYALAVCATAESIDIEDLVEFGSILVEVPSFLFMSNRRRRLAAKHLTFEISDERLLAILGDGSEKRAIVASQLSRHASSIAASALVDAVIEGLQSETDEARFRYWLRSAAGAPPSASEAAIWTVPKYLEVFLDEEEGETWLVERIDQLDEADLSRAELEHLRSTMACELPGMAKISDKVARAAVDALQRIDAKLSSPLADADWKLEGVANSPR